MGVDPGKEKEAEEMLEEEQGNTSSLSSLFLSSFSFFCGQQRGVAPAQWTVVGRRAAERRRGAVSAAGGGAGSFSSGLDTSMRRKARWGWRAWCCPWVATGRGLDFEVEDGAAVGGGTGRVGGCGR